MTYANYQKSMSLTVMKLLKNSTSNSPIGTILTSMTAYNQDDSPDILYCVICTGRFSNGVFSTYEMICQHYVQNDFAPFDIPFSYMDRDINHFIENDVNFLEDVGAILIHDTLDSFRIKPMGLRKAANNSVTFCFNRDHVFFTII